MCHFFCLASQIGLKNNYTWQIISQLAYDDEGPDWTSEHVHFLFQAIYIAFVYLQVGDLPSSFSIFVLVNHILFIYDREENAGK